MNISHKGTEYTEVTEFLNFEFLYSLQIADVALYQIKFKAAEFFGD